MIAFDHVEKIADALLYEGLILYPYRASSVKNRHRWTIGSLYPRAWSERENPTDPWSLQGECLVHGDDNTTITGMIRFLQFIEPSPIPESQSSFNEARERRIELPVGRFGDLIDEPATVHFVDKSSEMGAVQISCGLTVSAERVGADVFRFRFCVTNETEFEDRARDTILLRAVISPHAIFSVERGAFISLLDPEKPFADLAAGCRNIGTYPVLVGQNGRRDTVLSSPIILYDYPAIAPESPGNLFDATETDEILTLRILTLTDEEKREVRLTDPRARELLDRSESLSKKALMDLHGAARTIDNWGELPERPRMERLEYKGNLLEPGRRVRLAPGPRGDIMDIALAGRDATIVSIEQDYEDRVFVAVTVDDDPGRDLGAEGKPGHRFFFDPSEVIPL